MPRPFPDLPFDPLARSFRVRARTSSSFRIPCHPLICCPRAIEASSFRVKACSSVDVIKMLDSHGPVTMLVGSHSVLPSGGGRWRARSSIRGSRQQAQQQKWREWPVAPLLMPCCGQAGCTEHVSGGNWIEIQQKTRQSIPFSSRVRNGWRLSADIQQPTAASRRRGHRDGYQPVTLPAAGCFLLKTAPSGGRSCLPASASFAEKSAAASRFRGRIPTGENLRQTRPATWSPRPGSDRPFNFQSTGIGRRNLSAGRGSSVPPGRSTIRWRQAAASGQSMRLWISRKYKSHRSFDRCRRQQP